MCNLYLRVKVRVCLIEKFVDPISSHECIDDIKREEFDRTCKKIQKVQTRMVVIRMV